jgi:glycosyltransferase involved in cell wall biosynthesis
MQGGASRRVLVFEPEHVGHQPAYVRMLAEWLLARNYPERVTFAVSTALLDRLRAEDDLDLVAQRGVDVVVLVPADATACWSGPLYRRSFRRMALLGTLLRQTAASHVVAMFLDPLQLALALGLRLPGGARISGILFRPSIHAVYGATRGASWGERVRDTRKRLLYRLMLRNVTLERVLSLDPYFPAFADAVLAAHGRVVVLPDPVVSVPSVAERGSVGADLKAAFAGGRVSFSLFGALTDRKGVLQAIDALAALAPAVREGVRLVLAGRVDPAIAQSLSQRVGALSAAAGNGDSLRIVDRYLTTEELAWLVQRSDAILAPYQRFVGSSGVLTWAASARRPVIAQAYGLIGALVRDYHLGLTVETEDPAKIATAMATFADRSRLQEVARVARWADFCAGRSAADFAAGVLWPLLAQPGTAG